MSGYVDKGVMSHFLSSEVSSKTRFECCCLDDAKNL